MAFSARHALPPTAGLAGAAEYSAVRREVIPIALVCGAIAVAAGAMSLVGWWADMPLLRSVVPGTVGMKANTALAFVLGGAAVSMQYGGRPLRLLHPLERLCSALVFLIGALTLIEHLSGRDLGIDGMLIDTRADTDVATAVPGRMALATALNFTFIGLALGFERITIRHRLRAAEVLVVPPAAISVLVLLAYLYGAGAVYAAPAMTPVAVPTAIAFLVLSLGILVAVDGSLIALFTTAGARRHLAVRMIPGGIAALVGLGWLRVVGQREGLFETETGVALAVLVGICALLILVVWTGRSLHRAEAGRERAVRRLSRDLEERVRRRTKELEEANHELEAFSYSVSHDLRSPLRAISGYARILSDDHAASLDDEGRRLLGVVELEAQRMGRLIDDLLQFSRLGRKSIVRQSVDMTALAREAFSCIEGHEQVAHFSLGALPLAQGDEALLRVVWVNLIGNAVKFTARRASAHIEVGGERSDDAATFWVRDNGAGFDSRYAHNLFGVFQRLHRDDEFEGTGVGLAQVQRIIHRHGGSVRAEGEVDKGATLFFSLPVSSEERP